MSVEIVNLFTSSSNISHLKNEISKNIKNEEIREAILDSLTESIFDFQDTEFIGNPRHSTSLEKELNILNKKFIEDRIAFSVNFKLYADAREQYANQMFIDDSLRPGAYEHLNDTNSEDESRIFRYQDKFDKRKSAIPIWQVTKRGNFDSNNDSLRESDISQIRKSSEEKSTDHINTISTEIKRPRWIDI